MTVREEIENAEAEAARNAALGNMVLLAYWHGKAVGLRLAALVADREVWAWYEPLCQGGEKMR
jgi:hypothetical protein